MTRDFLSLSNGRLVCVLCWHYIDFYQSASDPHTRPRQAERVVSMALPQVLPPVRLTADLSRSFFQVAQTSLEAMHVPSSVQCNQC